MRLWRRMAVYLAWIGLLVCSFQASAQQAASAGAESNSTVRPVTGQQQSSSGGPPDSPSATRSQLRETENQENNLKAQSTELAPAAPQAAEPQPTSQSQNSDQPPQKPVGTAAVGPTRASGVAASQPAGVAVAPAKQRRARTIVLKVGAIVGAGAAVGIVIALTRASPSTPPGTR